WVHFEVAAAADGLVLRPGEEAKTTKLLTRVAALEGAPVIGQATDAFAKALSERPQIFELLDDIQLFESHNEIEFYTWGARECCLPKGATRAYLKGELPTLEANDVLVLVEKRGPETGRPEDADRTRRHAVRLTVVDAAIQDPLGGQFKPQPDDNPVPVTKIEWAKEDALPFALCVSGLVRNTFFEDVGVALGNIGLVDHGYTVADEAANSPDSLLEPSVAPGSVQALTRISRSPTSRCEAATMSAVAPRYRPRLKYSPITQASPYDRKKPPPATATRQLLFEDSNVLPLPGIGLREDLSQPKDSWTPRRDLLSSDPGDQVFVVEVEVDGTAYLRFGDGRSGRRPPEGTNFFATYRIGNGTAGNVGADSISHVVTSDPAFLDPTSTLILSVSNLLPATGGVDPETIEHVRQNAPSAFRRQERAVTPADYEALTIRKDVVGRCGLDVQRSAARLRWTGSWHTMFLTVDRFAGAQVDAGFEHGLRQCLERYRMAGQDLEVDAPTDVPLEIEMQVCISPGYFFEDVQQALLKVFSNRTQTDGSRGVFHPDNFTFGQAVLLSRIVAAAQAVTGVASVVVAKFQRQGIPSAEALDSGRLAMGLHEIARLDNDPNFPERGVFTLKRA
ncbi:MAG TPA: putative baseplate assembly protein, partial [Pyrinomonadaceae bacterium]|nr:putative baseplate assembly protein [Pyrinomonadaceae bacterium]